MCRYLLVLILVLPAVHSSHAMAQNSWKDDVVYFIMIDRFADGDITNNIGIDPSAPLAFHGGDLSGIAQNLDEVSNLGATAIWITPIVEQVQAINHDGGLFHGHHGYWANDFYRIDPRFGTEADLKQLVNKANSLNIKVILDVVYNHVGYDSDWAKVHKSWLRSGDSCLGTVETACISGLPDIRTELEEVRQHLFEAHVGLAERTGLHGFRVDTVKHIPHDFWQAHRLEVRSRLGPQFLLLGEVWDGDKYLAKQYFKNDELDAMTDFSLRQNTLNLLTGVTDAVRFSRYIVNRHKIAYGKLLSPFLSNHDMPMLLALLRNNKEKLKVAATILFSVEGLPVVAWGEEVGRKGGAWPHNRGDMPWGDKMIGPGAGMARDEQLQNHYRKLISIRKTTSDLTGHEIEVIFKNKHAFALRRGTQTLVLVNAGKNMQKFDLEELAKSGWNLRYRSNEKNSVFGLQPFSANILTL